MNKTLTTLIIIALAGILLWFGLRMMDSTQPQTDQNVATEQVNQNELTTPSADENNITDAEVSYTAQKVFFNQPTLEVIGKTNDVTGRLIHDGTILRGTATISTDNLATGNNMRDNDVRKLLGSEISVQIPEAEVPDNGNYDLPIAITINGVTQVLEFDTEVTFLEDTVRLVGQTDFNMSEFAVTPPSAFEIYTVEDEITLAFDVTANTNMEADTEMQIVTITGTITETNPEKDGHTVMIAGNDGLTYHTIISVPNLDAGSTFDFNDIKVGNELTITGEVWEMDGMVHLTAREVVLNN